MRVRIFESEAEAAEACATLLAQLIAAQPNLVLGLPTGRTPVAVYRALVAQHRRGGLDFSRVTTFNLDEFREMPADDASSYRSYMERHLFTHVNLAPERIQFLRGMAPDAEGECLRYDAALEAAGGLDVVMLGLGANGHLAFNEPGNELHARTHCVRLTRQTRTANAGLFGDEASRVPTQALTMGMGPLVQSRVAILLALGEEKAAAVKALVEGPVTPQCPASFLQLHREAEIWVDAAAAASLRAS